MLNKLVEVVFQREVSVRRRALLSMVSDIKVVQFSRSVVSDSLRPHGLQRTRLPCPSPTPGACSNSCLLSRWCPPTISSSVIPFYLQSFPASGCFPVSHVFTSGGQRIGASASVLPMNSQDWFPLAWGCYFLPGRTGTDDIHGVSFREQTTLCVSILERLLQALEPVHVARNLRVDLQRGLTHPNDSVKILTLSQVWIFQ